MKKFSKILISKCLLIGSITLLSTNFAPVQASAASGVATDIKGHWAASVINQAISDGYVTGYVDKTFKPNAQVTRVEFAAILSRVNDVENVEAPASGFNDIPTWAAGAVNQAVNMGYINKASYGSKLNPNEVMTRGEMAQWIANGLVKSNPEYKQALDDLKNTLLPFTEHAKFSQTQRQVFGIARGTGVITGMPDGSFSADRNVSRAETVTMIYRYINASSKSPTEFQALNELREVGTTGTNLMSMGGRIGSNREFSNIMETPLKTNQQAFEITLHKYIVIDSYKAQPTSVYANMFFGPGANPTKAFDGSDVFNAYSLLTYKTNVNSNADTLASSLQGAAGMGLLEGSKPTPLGKGFSLNTVTFRSSMTKGKESTVWLYTELRPGVFNTVAPKQGKNITFGVDK